MQPIPPVAELTAAVKKTLTSAAFSKFMEQAVHTAVAALQAEPQGVVLPGGATPFLSWNEGRDYRSYECSSADGQHTIAMQTTRMDSDQRTRNCWYGAETRVDAQGRIWTTQLGLMVQDDFGMLVQVPA